MSIRSLIACLVLFLLQGSVLGQGAADVHVREADRYYQQLAYSRAIEHYRTAAELGAVNEHVTRRLADCNMRLGNTQEAELWYAQAVKYLNREPRDLYNYAEALKSNGRYQGAEEWMDRYLQMVRPNPHQTRRTRRSLGKGSSV